MHLLKKKKKMRGFLKLKIMGRGFRNGFTIRWNNHIIYFEFRHGPWFKRVVWKQNLLKMKVIKTKIVYKTVLYCNSQLQLVRAFQEFFWTISNCMTNISLKSTVKNNLVCSSSNKSNSKLFPFLLSKNKKIKNSFFFSEN